MMFYETWLNFIAKVELVDKFMIHNKRKDLNIEFKRLMLESLRKGNAKLYTNIVQMLATKALDYFVVKQRMFFANNNIKYAFPEAPERRAEAAKFVKGVLGVLRDLMATTSTTSSSAADAEDQFRSGLVTRMRALFNIERSELKGSVTDYVDYVLQRTVEREDVVRQFGLEKWRGCVEDEYREELFRELTETLLPQLPDPEKDAIFFAPQDGDFAYLRKLYAISESYGCFKALEKFIFEHAKQRESAILARYNNSSSSSSNSNGNGNGNALVQELIAHKQHLDAVVKNGLCESPRFAAVIHDAFEAATAAEPHSSEAIARAIVGYFAEGTAAGTLVAEENRSSLECAMFVLGAAVPEKDEFEAIYRARLSSELVERRGKPRELKRFREASAAFIDGYLQRDLGAGIVKKVHGMVEDLRTSDDTNASFNALPRAIELDVKVLTRAYWPASTVAACASDAGVTGLGGVVLPQQMQAVLSDFLSFFAAREKRNQFMKLDIDCLYSSSVLQLEGSFPRAGAKTLVTSLPDALVLHCFKNSGGDAATLGFGDIAKTTGLREPDVKKIVRVLASKNVQILRVVGDAHEAAVLVNDNFENSKPVIRIRKRPAKDDVQGSSSRNSKVQQAEAAEKKELIFKREEHVDCALIRALKGSGPKSLDEIMAFVSHWVAEQSHFPEFRPDEKFISERLDTLVQRSFVVQEGNTYTYSP